jgi:hypothetical protein
MKFTLIFKTPAVLDQIPKQENPFDEDEPTEIQEAQMLVDKFVEFSEYIRVEFDTDKGIATVLPLRK